MAKHNGPISEGVKRAIKASDKTPYAIAKEVRENTKGKISLTPAQLYKFLAGDVGLSLAVLDEIAIVLGLVVQVRHEVSESSGSVAPILEGPSEYDPDRARRERRAGRAARNTEQQSSKDSVEEPRSDVQTPKRLMSLKDRIDAMKAEMGPEDVEDDDDEDPFADDDRGITGGPPPPRPSTPDYSQRGNDNYEPVNSNDVRQMFGTPTINAREYSERNQYLATKLDMNPGMRKLAEKYSKTGGKDNNGYEKAKFYHFVFQMMHQNPHAKEILALPDLADRYKEIAKKVPNPINMAHLGDVISPDDLHPVGDDPEAFYGNLHRILKGQGVSNGIVEPRKGPKPPGHC